MINFANFFGSGVTAAVSTRDSGNMSLSYGDASKSLDNRKAFLNTLGIDYRSLVCAKQIHASRISYISEDKLGRGALRYEEAIADTDALVTDRRNLPLAVFTADCLSVFLYDPSTPAISVVHAGWRSSREEIVLKTIKFMQDKFNAAPEKLLAAFGPCIRSCCYEVSGEFLEFFPDNLIKKDSRDYLDLSAVNKKQLLASGLREPNITDCRMCTFCRNTDFFSYRKESELAGRMMSVMMLK